MSNIIEIEGIGDVYATKLTNVGIRTTEELLSRCGSPAGRKELAKSSGIAESLILRWTNHADLFRVKGVQKQYAELLEASGVDTVVELARRDAVTLAAKLAEVNKAKNLANRVPTSTEVAKWIAEAKTLPRAVNY